ncbi:MAG: GNAT family N-acetyltransferase [Acidobacteria bacterium]|nr:GNAT family N-acetyltransferase [Acidobacteriota bacterium]
MTLIADNNDPYIAAVISGPEIGICRDLFVEYAEWLGFDLCFQGFDRELSELPGKYAEPNGRLYLAYLNGEPVGCIGLRPIGNDICEMKRLYLRPEARGAGLGKMLIERLIKDAREIGYKAMRLDTYPPKMAAAVKLYRAYGFKEIEAYYDNPYEGVLFMELSL